MKNRFTYKIR